MMISLQNLPDNTRAAVEAFIESLNVAQESQFCGTLDLAVTFHHGKAVKSRDGREVVYPTNGEIKTIRNTTTAGLCVTGRVN